jgi:TM2 domain-containing membrane protein YozV
MPDDSAFCPSCGSKAITISETKPDTTEKSKIVAGVFALLLGGFGAHKFYLRYKAQAIITLAVTLLGFLLFGIPTIIMSIIVIIEGFIYLTKSDQEFFDTYIINKRAWF